MSKGHSLRQIFRSPLRITGLLVLLVLGPLLWYFPLGDGIQRLSYDLPFPWRNTISTPEAIIIYVDESSLKALGQTVNGPTPMDRSLHTRLLNRLTRDGAKEVLYDIIFDQPSPNPQVDEDFAAAIARNGHVILGAMLDKTIVRDSNSQGVYRQEIYPPIPLLLKAAAAWGLVGFLPFDPDYAVRRLYVGNDQIPTASWAAAQLLNAPVTRDPDNSSRQRWLNYYGPPSSMASVSFSQALDDDAFAPGFFKDKIVFIGGRPIVGTLGASRELFANPYSRWGRLFFNGVEIHATEFLNLLRGDWLTEMPSWIELTLLFAIGSVVAFTANVLPPGRMLLTGIAISVLVTCAAFILEWHRGIWFDWFVPAGIVAPAGVIWCAASQYFEEARKRAALRHAFALYLSPQMADRIANSDFDLKPGGKLVEATVVFTDCQNFTAMSEEMNDPVKVSETLIAYFTETSRCVLENDGTIIKYIGDSVMAAWGAPVEEKDHPYKAALAACQLQEASKIVVLGRALKTRIGVASGPVVAGNLGSPYRFDYTLIGDTTNFASRLEGLNKYVNTSILISDSTRKYLGDRFVTRMVGYFALAGKSQHLPIHEMICPCSDHSAAGHRQWIVIFDEAIDAIKEGAFEKAKGLFRKAIWERGGADGPSEFYLKKIAQLEKENALQEWTGVVRLGEK